MTVTGAAIVLSWLPADSAGSSFFFPSGVRMKTKRAGELLAEVGPNFRMSYSSRSVSSETGSLENLLWVRASRNSTSSAAAPSPAGSVVIFYDLPGGRSISNVPQDAGSRQRRQAFGRLQVDLLDRDNFRNVVAQHVLDAVLEGRARRRAARARTLHVQPHDALPIAAEDDVAAVTRHRRTHACVQQFLDL